MVYVETYYVSEQRRMISSLRTPHYQLLSHLPAPPYSSFSCWMELNPHIIMDPAHNVRSKSTHYPRRGNLKTALWPYVFRSFQPVPSIHSACLPSLFRPRAVYRYQIVISQTPNRLATCTTLSGALQSASECLNEFYSALLSLIDFTTGNTNLRIVNKNIHLSASFQLKIIW